LSGKSFTWIFIGRVIKFCLAGKKCRGLDLNQPGSDHQEGGHFRSVLLFHGMHVFQELIGYLRQSQPGDIQLSAFD
jgi:hypothetical protein